MCKYNEAIRQWDTILVFCFYFCSISTEMSVVGFVSPGPAGASWFWALAHGGTRWASHKALCSRGVGGRGHVSRPPAVRTKDSKKIKRGDGGLAERACAGGNTNRNDSKAPTQRKRGVSVSRTAGQGRGPPADGLSALQSVERRSLRRNFSRKQWRQH